MAKYERFFEPSGNGNIDELCEELHQEALDHNGPHEDRFRILLGPKIAKKPKSLTPTETR